jgi:hypothetical protein
MTMHLEGPWLTTTGKKKGQRRWATAEAKRHAEFLQKEWEALKARHNVTNSQKTRARDIKGDLSDTYSFKVPPGRETPVINSVDTGWVPCTKHQDTEYTGTKVKGIGTMHKSNAVPIFSDQEAVDISKMRR